MRTFLDTNVLAAAFATRGFCSNLFQQVLESHELVSSLGILAELERILRKKFKIPASQIEEILAFLRSNSRLSEPHEKKPYRITDPDDMPHLSAAENAQCDVFVTGDKELHALNPIGAMQVLSPRDFWEMLSERP